MRAKLRMLVGQNNKSMNIYYYDKSERVILAVDADGNVNILQPIENLVGGGSDERSFQSVPVKITAQSSQTDRPKFTKGCSECGSVSKHKSGCSRPPKSEERYNSGTRKPMKRAPCIECKSKGNRHKNSCSKAGQSQSLTGNDEWAKLDEEDLKRKNFMSRRQYEQVKTAHNHGMDPTSIANEMGLGVKEVNTAILSKTFEQYSQ